MTLMSELWADSGERVTEAVAEGVLQRMECRLLQWVELEVDSPFQCSNMRARA